jgi:uncharacterized protein (DUF488 family)
VAERLRQDGAMIVHTIGHSTRSLEELIALLEAAGVDCLTDIRRFPASRRYPHFNAESLGHALPQRKIAYHHLATLGGRRNTVAGATPSRNTLWREAAFRAYSDYAMTPEFRVGFEALLTLAHAHHVAIMCAEAVWWQCHRRIVTDYLIAAGGEVRHIMGRGKIDPASLTPGAVAAEGGLIYRKPEAQPDLPGL